MTLRDLSTQTINAPKIEMILKSMINPSQLRFKKELENLRISDILSLIENKIDESQNLEYKEPSRNSDKDCNNLAETISGFLNTDGGIVLYGISEERDGDHRYPIDIKWCDVPKDACMDC